jgi:hypothetical protein
MKQMRIEQHKHEPADMFILRALAMAVPRMDPDQFLALAEYMARRGEAERFKR